MQNMGWRSTESVRPKRYTHTHLLVSYIVVVVVFVTLLLFFCCICLMNNINTFIRAYVYLESHVTLNNNIILNINEKRLKINCSFAYYPYAISSVICCFPSRSMLAGA